MWFIGDPHLYPLMRAAASGSTPSDVLLHLSLRLSAGRTDFHLFPFPSKNEYILGLFREKSVASAADYCFFIIVLLCSQSWFAQGEVLSTSRPWLRLACLSHLALFPLVVNSINGAFDKAGCVKSFSCSTALFRHDTWKPLDCFSCSHLTSFDFIHEQSIRRDHGQLGNKLLLWELLDCKINLCDSDASRSLVTPWKSTITTTKHSCCFLI